MYILDWRSIRYKTVQYTFFVKKKRSLFEFASIKIFNFCAEKSSLTKNFDDLRFNAFIHKSKEEQKMMK